MSAGELSNFMSWEGLITLAGALGLGGVLTAIIQRPSRKAINASAAKDEATGEAAVIASIATAFTGTTGALREEIERMQLMLNELRTRVVEAEAELRAAAVRESNLERENTSLSVQLETAQGDVLRLRAERDTAQELAIQREGEIRQLKSVIEAQARVTS
ncbi:hypothetical protein OB03_12920 [Brevundimonas sp. GN22]